MSSKSSNPNSDFLSSYSPEARARFSKIYRNARPVKFTVGKIYHRVMRWLDIETQLLLGDDYPVEQYFLVLGDPVRTPNTTVAENDFEQPVYNITLKRKHPIAVDSRSICWYVCPVDEETGELDKANGWISYKPRERKYSWIK